MPGMRQSAETENYMTSVERAFEYVKLKPEAPLESKPGLMHNKLLTVILKSITLSFVQIKNLLTTGHQEDRLRLKMYF